LVLFFKKEHPSLRQRDLRTVRGTAVIKIDAGAERGNAAGPATAVMRPWRWTVTVPSSYRLETVIFSGLAGRRQHLQWSGQHKRRWTVALLHHRNR
jgi:hypothetical protein